MAAKLIEGYYWLQWKDVETWTIGYYKSDKSPIQVVGDEEYYHANEFVFGPRIEENLAQKDK